MKYKINNGLIALLLACVMLLFTSNCYNANFNEQIESNGGLQDAIITVQTALPGCEYVTTLSSGYEDKLIFITPDNVEFSVWASDSTEYGGYRKILLSDYTSAIIYHYTDEIKNTFYNGVVADTNYPGEVLIYIDDEEYIKNAALLCVDLQNKFRFNITPDFESYFRCPTAYFTFLFKDNSDEYKLLNQSISMATTEEKWNNYDSLYDWLKQQYDNFTANHTI